MLCNGSIILIIVSLPEWIQVVIMVQAEKHKHESYVIDIFYKNIVFVLLKYNELLLRFYQLFLCLYLAILEMHKYIWCLLKSVPHFPRYVEVE